MFFSYCIYLSVDKAITPEVKFDEFFAFNDVVEDVCYLYIEEGR